MTATYDRTVFFDRVRNHVFEGMSQTQVEGCNAILNEGERRAVEQAPLAYVLATAWWETDHAMQPVREIGQGRGHTYGVCDPHTGQVYYGRGLVQITWRRNYATFSSLCGVDLVAKPDLALEMPIAVKIIFDGMIGGLFTGRRLASFFHGNIVDFTNARRIINGIDHASEIAAVARKFDFALKTTA